MTSYQFMKKYLGVNDGKARICSSIYKDPEGNIYSYGRHHPLLFIVNDITFVNISGYSVTTSKHTSWARPLADHEVVLLMNGQAWPAFDAMAVKKSLRHEEVQLQEAIKKGRDGTRAQQARIDRLEAIYAALYALSASKRRGPDNSSLKMIANVASLGNIFTDNKKDANDWKTRMLKAGLGDAINMPDDWDQLSDDEKERRLDGALEALK